VKPEEQQSHGQQPGAGGAESGRAGISEPGKREQRDRRDHQIGGPGEDDAA